MTPTVPITPELERNLKEAAARNGLTMEEHLERLALPLRQDESGAIRLGTSRVTLDVVLADYKSGLTPEEIVRQLDTLNLADVYAVIAYYHRFREEVEQYLRRREAEAEALRREIEAGQPDRGELKARLASRMAQGNAGDAPPGQ